MNKVQTKNLRCVKITLFNNDTCLLTSIKPLTIGSQLFCNLKRKKVFLYNNQSLHEDIRATLFFSLFIGIFNIERHNFFFFAENVQKVGKMKNHSVYQIKSVSYIPFDEKEISDSLIEKLLFVSNHLSKGYYFSYTLDLSKCFDRTFEFNNIFYVNKKLQNFLVLNEKMKGWAVPLIKGFFKTSILNFNGRRVRYTLVAKIQTENENVVEVNQIIEKEDLIRIVRYLLIDSKPNHLDEFVNTMAEDEKKVLMMNTISSKDSFLSKINAIETVAKDLTIFNDKIKYKYFSLKHKPQDKKDLLGYKKEFNDYYEVNKSFGYSQFNEKNIKTKTQDGFYVLLFYKKIRYPAFYFLLFNLYDELINFLLDNDYLSIFNDRLDFDSLKKTCGFDFLLFFEKMNRNINLILNDVYYNELTKLLEIKINSVNKAYLNRNREFFQKVMQESDFEIIPEIGKQSFRVMVFSYNIAGSSPEGGDRHLKSFFEKINSYSPDILVLGFQEIIELKIKLKNVKKMLNSIPVIKKWEYIFIRELPNYKLILDENCLGLQSFIFVKRTKISFLLSSNINKVKLGLMNMGNKGAIVSYLNYKGVFLEFINCHLSAGFGDASREQRSSDIKNIFKHTLNSNYARKLSASFFFGDTNFKVNLDREETLEVLRRVEKPFTLLEKHDDANYMRMFNPVFKEYSEMPITYPPTYKYNKDTRQFENVKKTPSWTDRVYFRLMGDVKMNFHGYGSLQIYLSDHHPVFFICDITK